MNGKLIVSERGRDRVHELCDDVMTIGGGLEADLLLRHPDVAQAHCEIRRLKEGFKVVDLETATGTQVNGKAVNQHLLSNGDTISLGDVRITFLGESASPPPVSRKAPPPPLRIHPRDETGQPRRFYRHEENSGLGTGPKVALIMGALSVLVLILVWLAKSVPDEVGTRQFAEAQVLMEKGDARSIEAAIKILESIPRGQVDERRINDTLEIARRDLHQLTTAKVEKEADEEYRRILDYHLSHPNDAGYLRGQIRVFAERYPSSPRLQDLEQRLELVQRGGPGTEAAWEKGRTDLAAALKAGRFKDAFATLASLEGDEKMSVAYADRIAVHRTTLEDEFRKHFEKMSAKAIDAHTRGNSAAAADIYRDLAEVGCEPYSSQAKRLLNKLQ